MGFVPWLRGAGADRIGFNEQIEPILSENCYACHGPDPGARKAGLRLDRAEYALAPHAESGPAIIPGNPDGSPLVQRVETKVTKERMPPAESHKTLAPEQIALLRGWIASGAEYQEHWAFLPPVRPPIPGLVNAPVGWSGNPIDAFILARLRRERVEPAPAAERRALIRRVAFDLTGLPPTPAEVDAFLADPSADAYERVVDRLLASSRYGEHRARYWLDYVRYADTQGLETDNFRSIWPYRDYVVRSFNTGKPFDRFVREQLAGDLMPARSIDELTATGFIRCNVATNEGGTIPEEVLVNQTRDRVETFGAVFLGLTTGCAACHDHKFDPLTQRDHYQLAAFFNNTAEKPWTDDSATPAPVVRVPSDTVRPAADALLAQRAGLQLRLDSRRASAAELVARAVAAGRGPTPVGAAGLELRLRLDENRGDKVSNSAPNPQPANFIADTNPLIWGETSWMWPAMRMDQATRLALGSVADVELNEKFSAGGWFLLRQKPGYPRGTGNGSLLSRMGDAARHGRGWDLYCDNERYVVNLVHDGVATPQPVRQNRPAPETADDARPPSTLAPAPPRRAIQVITRSRFPRNEWTHVFFTWDGSGKADGVAIYVNGQRVETDVLLDTLAAGDTIRTDAIAQLGRRDEYEPEREARYQDIRFYRRDLNADEVRRLPFEDVAAEIVGRKPNPSAWTTDETYVVVERYFLGEADEEARTLRSELASLDTRLNELTKDGAPSLIARERSTPPYADILRRGDYFRRVERVAEGTPHFLPPMRRGSPRNRLGLADWLMAADQPLFARVAVNRMWQEVFGRGLVETPGDFGIMGARPSHPELLDWLAVEFRESGWDVKKFYRLLVTSATYRQSARVTPELAAKDPSNKLLARGPRFRMEGEMLRDAALAASGLLVEKLGGPPVKPYQPAGLWEEVAIPKSNTVHYEPDRGEGLYRRSVYTFWKRGSPPPAMETFDATTREVACPRRARSNTPLQALVTMNDPQWVEAARKLAERAVRMSADQEARLDFLALVTLSRPLLTREKASLLAAEETYRRHFAAQPAAAPALLAVGEAPADPAIAPGELAAWTLVASSFFNLDEFLNK